MKTKTAVLNGKLDAGNPHVRFDEGEVASAKPRRGSLLYAITMPAFRQGVAPCEYAIVFKVEKTGKVNK